MRSELGEALSNVGLDPGLKSFGASGVGADDEDSVVAGDGPDDLRPLLVVEAGRNRLCAADRSEDDKQVLGLSDFEPEVGQDSADLGKLFFGFADRRQLVSSGALEQLELADVPRERGLRDMDAAGGEFAAQFVLVDDGGLHQEVANRVVALIFHLKNMQISGLLMQFARVFAQAKA